MGTEKKAAIGDDAMLAAVKRLAAQSVQGHSDQIPLRPSEGLDTSLGGRFWIQFRLADCAEKDALMGAGIREVVRNGVAERTQNMVGVLDKLISFNLIRAGNLPALKGPNDDLVDLVWPKDESDQKRLVRPRKNTEDLGLSWESMTLIIGLAFDFYFEDEEAVDALGESSTASPTSPGEEEDKNSSTL
jgi:hypothetical protein